MVGLGEHGGKIVEQTLGARVGERLEHGPDVLVIHLFRGAQRGVQFRRVVGVVVGNRHAVDFAEKFEPASGSAERADARFALLIRAAGHAGQSHGRERVVHVVTARHTELKFGHDASVDVEIERIERRAVLAHIDGLIVGAALDAERAHVAVHAAQRGDGVVVVHVDQDRVLRQQRKFAERHLEVLHGFEVFHVIRVDVQDHAHVGNEVQERVVVFAGLHDDLVAGSVAAVSVDGGQLAADDGRGVLACVIEDLDGHGRRCRFAVRTRNAQRVRIRVRHIAEQDAALGRGDSEALRLLQFGIVRMDRGAVHDKFRAVHIFRLVPHHHLNAHGALAVNDVALVDVRTCDLVADSMQNLHKRKHTAAADADKMQFRFAVQQIGIKTVHPNKTTFVSDSPRRFNARAYASVYSIIFFFKKINNLSRFFGILFNRKRGNADEMDS